MALQPHEERMVAEGLDLGAKIRALGAFLKADTFKTLDQVDQDLLSEQHGHMVAYFSVLQKRIDRISAAKTS